MQHVCFRVLSLQREESTTAEGAHRTTRSSSSSSSRSIATVVVRTATPTPDLGHLRRLPRQAMHRAGASPRTIKKRFFFCSDLVRRIYALVAVCSLLCQYCRAGVVASFRLHFFIYMCLTTALCVSRIRRKTLECIQAEGILAVTKCAGAVCTPLYAGRCALLVLLFVLLLSSLFFFQRLRYLGEIKQNSYEHIRSSVLFYMYRIYAIRA